MNNQLTKKYTRKDDSREHLARWTKVWGGIPQPEWVHIFVHTLDVIPKSWYLETKLRNGTTNWDEMKEKFCRCSVLNMGSNALMKHFKKLKQ